MLIPSPHIHPWPVLQRLRDVRRGDLLGARQIGDRARQLEHAVEGPRREVQALGVGV